MIQEDEEEGESEADEMRFEEQKNDSYSSGLDPDDGKTPLNASLVDSTINELISNSSNANEPDVGFTGNIEAPRNIEMVDLKMHG